jgi:hypothetical protein
MIGSAEYVRRCGVRVVVDADTMTDRRGRRLVSAARSGDCRKGAASAMLRA